MFISASGDAAASIFRAEVLPENEGIGFLGNVGKFLSYYAYVTSRVWSYEMMFSVTAVETSRRAHSGTFI